MIRRAFAMIALCSAAPSFCLGQTAIAITHVNVVDVVKGRVLRDRTVVIRGDRIVDVRRGKMRMRDAASVIDGSGKFLIPGFWDMHYHFEQSSPGMREYNMLLANGVLGIRDMGDTPETIFPAREDIASGRVLGPRIVACGPIVDGPSPTNPPLSVSVAGSEDARAMVRRIKDMGSDCIKVHDGVPLDAYLAIADEAKTVRRPFVGHVPVRVKVLRATNAGQRSIEHEIGLRGASTVEDEVMEMEKRNDVFAEAMRTGNFSLIPESIAKKGNYILDHFSDQRAKELYRAYARNGTYLDPTLVTDYSLTFVDELIKKEDSRLKYIPAGQRDWWDPQRGMLTRYRTPAYIAFRKRRFEKTLQQIPVAFREGVQFLTGTDTTLPFVYPGFSVHDEMSLFVRAGLTPLQALQTATTNPVKFLGLEQSLGSVSVGKIADLVLLDANPLQDIANAGRIHVVIRRGRVLSRKDLDAMLLAAQDSASHR